MNFATMTATQRTEHIAETFGIKVQIDRLKESLMEIDGVVDVEFDLDGLLDNIYQVIILAEYKINAPLESYYTCHSFLRRAIFDVARAHDLIWSGDPIEDYGQHFYFVMECRNSWIESIKKGKAHED